MTMITGLGTVTGARVAQRRRLGPAFHALGAEAAEAAEAAAAPAAVEFPSLLAMQEASSEPAKDRDARRHGKAMLDALARLQRALLGGGGVDALESLANLVRATPQPDDPGLAAVQRAVLVRAAVELQRARLQAAAAARAIAASE